MRGRTLDRGSGGYRGFGPKLDKVGRSCAFASYPTACCPRDVSGCQTEREGRSARRVRQCIPDSGSEEEDPLYPRHSRHLPAGLDRPDPERERGAGRLLRQTSHDGREPGPLFADQSLFRRRAAAAGNLRAGIMPYITASIILQLLTVVIPRLEALKKEGQAGQA